MHKHHIIPKHMGGSDEPWNLMELSRRDHGLAHLVLYKLYGHKEDLWAANWLLENETLDISGDKNPMADPEIRKKHQEAIDRRMLRDPDAHKNWGLIHKPESIQKMKDNHWARTDPTAGANFGEKNGNWKGGSTLDENGKRTKESMRRYHAMRRKNATV